MALKLAWRWAVVAARAWLKLSLDKVHSLVSISGVQHVTPRGQIFRWIPENKKKTVRIIFREARHNNLSFTLNIPSETE